MASSTRTRLLVTGGVFAVALGTLLVVPALFGGAITARAKRAANDALDATIDWRSAGVSLFGDFPNLTLRLDDLAIVNRAPFAGDTLARVGRVRVVLDLASAVRSAMGGSAPIVVRAVELDAPRVTLVALEDGRANWQITKPSADTTASKPLSISLKRFAIKDGIVSYDDRAGKVRAELAGISQTLSGDFAKSQVDVAVQGTVDSVTVDFAGIRYLNQVQLALKADIAADMAARTYTLGGGSGVTLNALQLNVVGSVAQVARNLKLDLAFAAPGTDFKSFLSLVPAVYARDFADVKTTGTLALKGQVRGEYGDKAFPAFALVAKVADGTFRYPDLPLPARDIALDLEVRNPGGRADNTIVNLQRLHLVLGTNPIDASLVLRTPISDPDIDAKVQGRLDLADLKKTVKLPDVQELRGTIAVDAAVRTRLSSVDQGAYDRVSASGTIEVRDLAVQSAGVGKPIRVQEASLSLAPQRAELRSFTGTIGGSDLRASGQIDNLVGYLFRDDDLVGRATVSSNTFLVDEWKSDSSAGIIPVPPKVDLTLQATVGELVYGKLRMTDARGQVRLKDQRVTLEGFTLNTLGGAMAMSGFYETTTPGTPTFDFGMKVTTLDIPSAFSALTTVQQMLPMAKYMQGTISADFRLNGPLGENLVPLFQQLTGQGTMTTTQVAITNFPPLVKAATATKLTLLNNPTLRALSSQFEVKDGRFRMKPFTVGIGSTTMTVAGSNGFDQTLDYTLNLTLPRALMGGADAALQGLSAKAKAQGIDLATASEVALGITMRGSITDPVIGTDLGRSVGTAAQAVGAALQDAATTKVAAVVDSVQLRAAAARASAVREAEQRAEQLRTDARALAEKIRLESGLQADSLVARAGENPLKKRVAEATASRIRKEGESRAAKVVAEGDAKAALLVNAAREAGQ